MSSMIKKAAIAIGAYYLLTNLTTALPSYKSGTPSTKLTPGMHQGGTIVVLKDTELLPDGVVLLNESWSSSVNWDNLQWRCEDRLGWQGQARQLAIYMQAERNFNGGKTLWRYYGAIPD